jgi:threonyl-tRNA synthetase
MIKDALGRSWQLGTIQVDYNLPERFQLEYIGTDNQPHRPVMIHRAPFGSMERFISILIEHTGGQFPLWLAPEQYSIITVGESYNEYAHSVARQLELNDIRGIVDDRSESVGRKIRDAEVKKIPIMIIIGEEEMLNKTVSVRLKGGQEKGNMSIQEFLSLFKVIAGLTEQNTEPVTSSNNTKKVPL